MNCSIHILPNCGFSSGGPSRSVPNLIEALNESGETKAILLTAVKSNEDIKHLSHNPYIIPILVTNFYKFLSFYFVIFRHIKYKTDSVVHIHSLFNLTTTFSMLLCILYSRHFVIQPRGMLEPWSLRQSYWKKKLFITTVGKIFFKNAEAVICTSEQEKKHVKLIFPKSTYFVVPNIVKLNINSIAASKNDACLRNKLPNTFVFFSRLHPKKNIEFLVEIFSDPSMSAYKLHIYGYNDSQYSKKLVRDLSIHENINYCGVLNDINFKKIKDYEALLFSSFSENFGMVILEALYFNLPVVVNRELPWTTFEQEDALCCLNLVKSDWIELISGGFPNNIKNSDIKLSSKRICDYFSASRISKILIGIYSEF